MTDQTKTKALEKLSKLNVKIGYPEVWDDYEGLDMASDKVIMKI